MNATTLRSRVRYWWRKEIRWWLIIGLVIFSLRSSLADWNDVPTGSMKPTILEGDRVFVNKLAYDLKVPFTTRHLAEWSNPHRGDIVVFFSPHDGTRLVKRVVGLPGDTIELRNDGSCPQWPAGGLPAHRGGTAARRGAGGSRKPASLPRNSSPANAMWLRPFRQCPRCGISAPIACRKGITS